jgi:membrane protein implicated in regulation of membrane protease activity
MCHLILIGLPLLALSAFWFLPLALALPTFVVLIAATVLFYAFLVKGARRPMMNGTEALLHALGRVRSLQGDTAAIWVNSELWSAQSGEELHEGDEVEVMAVEGLLLRVRHVISGTKKEPNGNCHT